MTTSAATAATPTTAAASALRDRIAETLYAIDEPGAIRFTTTEALCTADRVVADIGEPRLLELGADQDEDLTALDWSGTERETVFSVLQTCVDLPGQLASFFAEDGSFTAEQAACMAGIYVASAVFPEALFSTEPDDDLNARIDDVIGEASASCA